MHWVLVANNILVEKTTGFTIFLLRGSWCQTEEIKPLAPENMPFLEQAQLLREGLEFAEIHDDPNKQNMSSIIDLYSYQYQQAS